MATGWSGAAPVNASSCTSRSALRAAAPSRARNSCGPSSPEQEQVTSKPPFLDQLHRQDVQVEVLSLAGGDFLAIEDQLGRVEDDHSVSSAVLRHLPGVAECVGVNHVEPDVVGVAVLASQGHGLLVQVDARDLAGLAADQRVQAKAAGITAQVEHRPPGTKPGELAAVVALIAEEAGLVASVEMDAVADSMLLHGHARRQPRALERPARKILLLRDPLVDANSKVRRPQPLGAERQGSGRSADKFPG